MRNAGGVHAIQTGDRSPAQQPAGESQTKRRRVRRAPVVRDVHLSAPRKAGGDADRGAPHKELELPLFPGYVFVQIAPQNRLQVLKLPGVVRLVTFNGQPAALPLGEVEALRNRLSASPRIEPHPYLRVGRRVRVRSGPMQGLEGIILRKKDSCRVIFSIDLIRRSVAVEVDEFDVEVVS